MSDRPIGQAFLDALINAEKNPGSTYSSVTSNDMPAMPAMPRCSLFQYVTKNQPTFYPDLIVRNVYRLPGVYLKFTRDILQSICARLGHGISKGSLNPKNIWIEDGGCRIPPANKDMRPYLEGFQSLMMYMYGDLQGHGNVELDDFLEYIPQLITDLKSFRRLLLHPFLHTTQQKYIYPVIALHVMHTLKNWRPQYISVMKYDVQGGCLDLALIAQDPLFAQVLASRKQKYPQNPNYSCDVDGVVDFVRNVYTHCNDHPNPITKMKDVELKVARSFPYNNLNLYTFFESLGVEERCDFFGVFMKTSDYGDLGACTQ